MTGTMISNPPGKRRGLAMVITVLWTGLWLAGPASSAVGAHEMATTTADERGGPVLGLESGSLDFGLVPVHAAAGAQRTTTLHNNGKVDATGVSVQPVDGFSADTAACGILTAGGSCELAVIFSPAGTDPASATLVVNTDQGATVVLEVAGEGVETLGGETDLISRAGGVDGVKGNASSQYSSISEDGRFVAFSSEADNLHPDDPDGGYLRDDVFVRDMQTQELILVSRASGVDGAKGNFRSYQPSISAGGRRVAFRSAASSLHPDAADGISHAYVRDLLTHETMLVSRASGPQGMPANQNSYSASISANGRFVIFNTLSNNLHPDDTNNTMQVHVRDLLTHDTILVSRASGVAGAVGNDDAEASSISPDGRLVAFTSTATNLHEDATDGTRQIYIRDLASQETLLISRASGPDGVAGDADAHWYTAISTDHRLVAFASIASNLHPEINDGFVHVFVRDLQTHETILASRASGATGVQGNSHSGGWGLSFSANGRFLAFASDARNLHPHVAGNNYGPVYVRDLRTHEMMYVSRASGAHGNGSNSSSHHAAISADGRFVSFESRATNLYPGPQYTHYDVYRRDVLGPPDLMVTPYLFDLGSVVVSETGDATSVTVANVGAQQRTISEVSLLEAPFAFAGGTCGAPPFTLAPGTSCTLDYVFRPTEYGPVSAVLRIDSDARHGPHMVILSGMGIGSLAALQPALDFGAVKIGNTVGPASVTLANIAAAGEVAVSELSSPEAPFRYVGGTCGEPPFTLVAGADCTLEYLFRPTLTGAAEATVTVFSDSLGSPDTFRLHGTGLPLPPPVIAIDPFSLAPSLPQGGSKTLTFDVANQGEDALTWTTATAAVSSANAVGPLADQAGFGPVEQRTGEDATHEQWATAWDPAPVAGAALSISGSLVSPAGVVDCDGEPGIIIHDDGTPESAYTNNPVAMAVDRFTPSFYPASFRAVCVAFASMGPASLDFEIVVFADDGPDGGPGTELGAMPARVEGLLIAQLDAPWFSFDISSLFLSIPAGSVYIGVRWEGSNPPVYIQADESPGNPAGFAGGYWWNDGAGFWTPIQDVPAFSNYRSLFVRAVESEPVPCADASTLGWLSLAPANGETPGGDSSLVEVSFDAAGLEPGGYEALVCVFSNDPQRPLVEVPVNLIVTPLPPALEVVPDVLNFGTIEVGAGADGLSVTLNSTGGTPVTITGISTPAAPFARTGGDCPAAPFALDSEQSCTLEFSFTPAAEGRFNATVVIIADIDPAVTGITLTGEGIITPPPSDIFQDRFEEVLD